MGALDRARTLLNTPRWEDAARVVKSYIASHPESSDAHSLMGLILYRQHQPRASMAEYMKASESGDLSAFDLRIFALDCAAIPDLPEAEKWLLRSIERDDRDAATWEALGHVRFSAQHYEEAIESLQHALQLAPRTVSAESLIGLANERLARPEVAEASYRTAIEWQTEREEKDAVPFTGLGRVLLADNKPGGAIPWLQQAAKIPPPSSEVHELLGLSYSKIAREAEAATELETAIRLQPNSARLHLILARIYRSMGAKEKADAELEIYAKLNGSDAP
jgi:tetratricopeptide (TPR) repeat protein